jgi:hypothetical protein
MRHHKGTVMKLVRWVPVYVLQANNDQVIGSARTEALVRSLPQPPVRWEHVATGHNSMLRTDAFCQALRF